MSPKEARRRHRLEKKAARSDRARAAFEEALAKLGCPMKLPPAVSALVARARRESVLRYIAWSGPGVDAVLADVALALAAPLEGGLSVKDYFEVFVPGVVAMAQRRDTLTLGDDVARTLDRVGDIARATVARYAKALRHRAAYVAIAHSRLDAVRFSLKLRDGVLHLESSTAHARRFGMNGRPRVAHRVATWGAKPVYVQGHVLSRLEQRLAGETGFLHFMLARSLHEPVFERRTDRVIVVACRWKEERVGCALVTELPDAFLVRTFVSRAMEDAARPKRPAA